MTVVQHVLKGEGLLRKNAFFRSGPLTPSFRCSTCDALSREGRGQIPQQRQSCGHHYFTVSLTHLLTAVGSTSR